MRVSISRKGAGFHEGEATQVAVASGSIVVNFSDGFATIVPFEDLGNLVVRETARADIDLELLGALEQLLSCTAFRETGKCGQCEGRAKDAISNTHWALAGY